MPIKVTYPGVYVQEVPSGVRTITGVGTSTAVFIGRTKSGPMDKPVLCLNFSDFERTFSSEYADSDMARSVRLFFQNGGTQCYVMRIADGALQSSVTLKNEKGTDEVLQVKAKSAGVPGDKIRLAVTYNGLEAESTFNLEVFRWAKNSTGAYVKTGVENYSALTMDPASPRYAVQYVTQDSQLVELEAPNDLTPANEGYSRSGRLFDTDTLVDDWSDLTGTASGATKFRISVDGGAFVDVDLAGIDFSTAPFEEDDLKSAIEGKINHMLPAGTQVTVSFEEDQAPRKRLNIASATGDVKIQPAADNDLAVPLMLGTAQGGIEFSRYAKCRPAANGIVFDIDKWNEFAILGQDAFGNVIIDSETITLNPKLQTVGPGAKMYQDGYAPSPNGNCDGVREKWAIIAKAVNDYRAENPGFKWSAEVWGSRLALLPLAGGDNSTGSFSTSTGDIGTYFFSNVRYYSLGEQGAGNFQVDGTAGSDGNAPVLNNYRNAFKILDKEVDLFNLMVLPADEDNGDNFMKSLWGPASIFCQKRRAFLLMDAPRWQDVQEATNPSTGVNSLRIGLVKDHSALFYPRVIIKENGLDKPVGPSGAIAGLMARIDSSRGVWKAPAGTEAGIRGITGLEQRLSDDENGILNPRAINTLRVFPNGIVNWGARTMDGDNDFGSEYKYIPIRRLALFIEESLYRGLKWVVFEPNDEPLWAQIRLNAGTFMHGLFRQGAFQGQSAKDAYFVKCDSETTTQNDRNQGIVNIWIGFAPLKPAEFVILYLQQMAGQLEA